MAFDKIMKKVAESRPWRREEAPIGACVTIGRRAKDVYGDEERNGRPAREGTPFDRTHLYVMEFKPSEQVSLGGRSAPARRPHPSFMVRTENGRRVPCPFEFLRVTFVHQKLEDAIDVGLYSTGEAVLRKHGRGDPPPHNRPFCSSRDGDTAERWNGDGYKTIRCHGEGCPVFMDGMCKFNTRAVFRVDPVDLGDGQSTEAILAYTASKSPQTRDVWGNFAEFMRREFERLGIPEDMRGVRAELTIRTKRGEKREYPVLNVATIGELEEQIHAAATRREEIRALVANAPSAQAAAGLYPDADETTLTGEQLRPMVVPRPEGTREPATSAPATEAPRQAQAPAQSQQPAAPASSAPRPSWLPLDAPPLVLGAAVEKGPDGEPTCPLCQMLMVPTKGKSSWGWLCSDRKASNCHGMRSWDGGAV